MTSPSYGDAGTTTRSAPRTTAASSCSRGGNGCNAKQRDERDDGRRGGKATGPPQHPGPPAPCLRAPCSQGGSRGRQDDGNEKMGEDNEMTGEGNEMTGEGNEATGEENGTTGGREMERKKAQGTSSTFLGPQVISFFLLNSFSFY